MNKEILKLSTYAERMSKVKSFYSDLNICSMARSLAELPNATEVEMEFCSKVQSED